MSRLLPFTYETEGSSSGMTAFAGLPLYLDLACVLGLPDLIRTYVKLRQTGQGYTDVVMILILVLLQLAGGNCVDDLKLLETDQGFARIMKHLEPYLMPGIDRNERQRRFRRKSNRAVPSPSSVFRYLSAFHNCDEEAKRRPGTAFVPAPNEFLTGLQQVNREVVGKVAELLPQEQVRTATLDADATLIETEKKEALYSYKGPKAYQPVTVMWSETGMICYSEFRDGNVPAGYKCLDVLKSALASLPPSVEKVYYRADSASYEWDLLKYMARNKDPRFGVIEFSVSADLSPELRQAIEQTPPDSWKPLTREVKGKAVPTGQQWAEVSFVPNNMADSKKDDGIHFLAIRELIHQQPLSGNAVQLSLPFPTVIMDSQKYHYKVSAIVTNRQLPGDQIIWWHREHCGTDEQSHAELKSGLAGGKLPSGQFGANVAWWETTILAFNLNQAMKRLVLGQHWLTKELKAIRFAIITVAGRVLERARQFYIRLSACNFTSHHRFTEIRKRIAGLGFT